MKKKLYGIVAISALLIGCGESHEAETTDANEDTAAQTEVVAEEEMQEEETPEDLAFDGVDKGDFKLYGHSEITADDAIDSDAMFAKFDETGEFNGKVKVNINEVCQMAGCWINIKKSDDDVVKVFFRDHFTIPIESSAGKEAVLYGNLVRDTMTVDFQKHLLDDSKANGEEVSEEEYAAITEDKITVSFDCESILVKN